MTDGSRKYQKKYYGTMCVAASADASTMHDESTACAHTYGRNVNKLHRV